LAIPYPFVPTVAALESLPGVWVLAAISAVTAALRKKRPYLLLGWLWYLGMLVPVIGIIQISPMPPSDRYNLSAGNRSGDWQHMGGGRWQRSMETRRPCGVKPINPIPRESGLLHRAGDFGGLMAAVIGH